MSTPAPAKESRLTALAVIAAAIGGFSGLLGSRWDSPAAANGTRTAIGFWMLAAAPLYIGMLGGLFLRRRPVVYSLLLITCCLVFAAPLFGEGAICILIYSPIALSVVALSAWVTALIKKRARAKSSSLSPLLLLPFIAVAYERALPPSADQAFVSSSAVIARPIESVWATLDRLQLPFVADSPWMVRELLPCPIAIEGSGTSPGAERRIIFHNGVVLAKVVASHAPDRFEVSLSIESSGREFFDHWVGLTRSEFLLESLPHGRTRITHVTHYTPRMFPRWYWAPIERELAGLIQGYMLDAYAKQIFPVSVAQAEGR